MNPLELTVTRTIATTPEKMWQAWTTEAGLASWLWHTWPDTRYQVDATVGGSYRIEAADHGIGVHGTYQQVRLHERLDFSGIWISGGVDGDIEQVTVIFTPDGDGTRIDLLHTGPWTTIEPVENYRQGWYFVLSALAGTAAER